MLTDELTDAVELPLHFTLEIARFDLARIA